MKSGQAYQTTTMEDNHKSSGFNKTDIENLKKLLNQLEGNNANSSQISGSCSMAQSDKWWDVEAMDVGGPIIVAENNQVIDDNDPNLNASPSNLPYNEHVVASSNAPTNLSDIPTSFSKNEETIDERPKTLTFNVYSRRRKSILTSVAPIVNLDTLTEFQWDFTRISHRRSLETKIRSKPRVNHFFWSSYKESVVVVSPSPLTPLPLTTRPTCYSAYTSSSSSIVEDVVFFSIFPE
ncbi:hypothetical protein LWI28_009285 [Acer negundo]|uniref:Uncharacterized protein n=1 Tax=Acer negundo TaxID=4023 RepID=A0AAD5ICX9_ACENE|nr:hypothetical protein LWI28_009285 [Acer negundo]